MEIGHIPYDQRISYALGELNEAKSAVVVAHTDTCDACNSTVVRLRTIRGLVREDFVQDPPAATIARAQAIFRQAHTKPPPQQPARAGWLEFFRTKRRSLAYAGLTALLFALVLMFGQAVVVSAGEAIPGDLLYPVKINVEALQVTLSMDKGNKVERLVVLAQNRIDEIAALKETERFNYIPATVTAYENAVRQAATFLDGLGDEDADRAVALGAEVSDDLSHHIDVLTSLLDQVPEPAKPAIAHAISVSQNGKLKAEQEIEKGKLAPKSNGTPTATRTRPVTPPGLQRTPGPPGTPPGKFVTPGVPPGKDQVPGPPATPPGKFVTPGVPPGKDQVPGPPATPPGKVNSARVLGKDEVPGPTPTPLGQAETPGAPPGRSNSAKP